MTRPKGNTVKIRNSTRCCDLHINEPDNSPIATGESREGVRVGRESEDLPDRFHDYIVFGNKDKLVFGRIHSIRYFTLV